MKKKKDNEIVKVAVVTVLSIGVFSAAFIGANNVAFATSLSKTDIIPPATTSVNVTELGNTLPKNYQKPTLSIYETPNEYYTKSVNALSTEEVAELGAQYIWEVLGENIDGKVVELFYSAHPSNTRVYWQGSVADSATDLANHKALFRFEIDAISGERIGIYQNLNRKSEALELEEQMVDRLSLRESMASEIPTQIDEYKQLALEYAQKHFSNTKVIEADFMGISVFPIKMGQEVNTIVFKEKVLHFNVKDETGREATIVITTETKQLSRLDTSHNDIVPGFNADIQGSIG